MEKTYCYWSIGNKFYSKLLQTLVSSARRVGITEDFHVWSDRKIKGAITHDLNAADAEDLGRNDLFAWEFKFRYLKKMLDAKYDYYIFIDADCYFVRKPRNPLSLLQGDPMHVFLETDLAGCKKLTRTHWWKNPVPVFVEAMKDLGVRAQKIHNVNGGFFIVERESVHKMCDLAYEFIREGRAKGYNLTVDEEALSYAMHILCSDTEKHLLENNLDFIGHYQCDAETHRPPFNRLPGSRETWPSVVTYTGEKAWVSPAIIHCIGSKLLLLSPLDALFYKATFRLKRMLRAVLRLVRVKHQ